LAGLFVLMAIVGEGLARFRRIAHSAWYGFGSGAMALWSLLLVTLPLRGIENPGTALWVYGLYGAAALLINARWRRPLVTSTGLALIVACSLWTCWWRFKTDAEMASVPRWGTALAIEALVMGGIAWLIRRRLLRRCMSLTGTAYQEPLARSAEAT